MEAANVKQGVSKHCNCHCCLTSSRSIPNSFDHQNSANITNSSTFHYDFATATSSSLYPHTLFTNPESIPPLQDSLRLFTRSFPQYLSTVEVDQLRKIHYHHLSQNSHVCLDYCGHALFSFSQQNAEFVASSSSNPCLMKTHFEICNGTSDNDSELELKLKGRMMKYLNICEEDYSLFFTANQTSAFRVLADCYPFHSKTTLLTVYDHENEAVEAMIEGSRRKGARVSTAEFKWPKLKIHSARLEEMVVGNKNKKKKVMDKGLFVFPLQSRVSGARYSYQWMNMAQDNGWHVLLDATALGPKDMDTLGLSLFQPHFIICTFYKVFGDDPSGFSCLFVKKSVTPLLHHPPHIASIPGIVSLKIHQTSRYHSNNNNITHIDWVKNEEFEVECKGLDHADSLGLVLIGTRTRCLINWLVNALQALSHPNSHNGVQLVAIYGPRVRFDRGLALAINIFDWKGERIDPMLVQKLADRNNISLGCGYMKHIWFSERYEDDKRRVLEKTNTRSSEGNKGKCKGSGKKGDSGIAVVTASLSFVNNFEDVYKLWEFVAKFLDADFVEKERWRYTALNQKTIEV